VLLASCFNLEYGLWTYADRRRKGATNVMIHWHQNLAVDKQTHTWIFVSVTFSAVSPVGRAFTRTERLGNIGAGFAG